MGGSLSCARKQTMSRPSTSPACQHAGWREWPAFRSWFARNLTPALNAWMGEVDVVYDGQETLDPAQRYVFGYAPHGLFPIGERPLRHLIPRQHACLAAHMLMQLDTWPNPWQPCLHANFRGIGLARLPI